MTGDPRNLPPASAEPTRDSPPPQPTSTPVRARRRNLAAYLGVLLVVFGLSLSPTVLESTIYPDGTIEPGSRRILVLTLARFILGGCGLFLLLRRPRVTLVHVSAFAILALLCSVLGAVGLQLLFRPAPITAGWRSFASPAEFNGLQFRGQPIAYSPGDFVIVLLGDSHVESRSLPFKSMPERRLEAHLQRLGKQVKVFTLGTGGYGQDQQLLVLGEFLQKYRADRVVLWQEPRNDVWNNMFRTHMFGRQHKPTFWLEAGALRGPTATMGEPLAASPIAIAALWQRVVGLPFLDKTWEDRLPAPYVPLPRPGGVLKMDWQERWDSNRGLMRQENLATEKSHMLVTLTPRSKRTQYGLDLTRALTGRIETTVKEQGGKLLVMHVDTPYFSTDEDEIYLLNDKCYCVSKRQYLANLQVLTEGFEATTIPVTVADWKVGPEDSHLNVAATDQVMGELALRLGDSIPGRKP